MMPWNTKLPCEGPPGGRCPKKKGTPTRLCQGDMTLCKTCEGIRFPPDYAPAPPGSGAQDAQQQPASSTTVRSDDPPNEAIQEVDTRHANYVGTSLDSLSQLETCADPSTSFMLSLDVIYSYNADDIREALNKLPIEALVHQNIVDLIKTQINMLQQHKKGHRWNYNDKTTEAERHIRF